MRYEIVETPFGNQLTRFNDNGSVSHIPQSEDNSDYQEYLKWVEANQ